LGCGTGAVALAAAASLGGGAVVTATDRENRSLTLATANAARNGLEVRISPLDYATDEAVAAFAARHAPFDLVLGAALMELSTSPRLWSVLRALTAPGGAIGVAANDAETTADATAAETTASTAATATLEVVGHQRRRRRGSLVALAHTVGAVASPPEGSGFVEVARVAGLSFGLHTRWSESESDFEVVVARRVK